MTYCHFMYKHSCVIYTCNHGNYTLVSQLNILYKRNFELMGIGEKCIQPNRNQNKNSKGHCINILSWVKLIIRLLRETISVLYRMQKSGSIKPFYSCNSSSKIMWLWRKHKDPVCILEMPAIHKTIIRLAKKKHLR